MAISIRWAAAGDPGTEPLPRKIVVPLCAEHRGPTKGDGTQTGSGVGYSFALG